jgi:RND family efflux transporter MFP subunit
MSPGQIDRLGRTRIIPADIQIASPGSGFVLERNVTAGERFVRGAQLYVIADLSRVWIEADLVGPVAIHVRPGMAAEVHVPGLGTVQHAVVSSTLPEFDPATQSLTLRLEAENRGIVLRPGMFVDATLSIELPPAIAVPVDAVMDAGTGKRVFIERATGVFEPRDVSTGWRLGGNVEIVKGIAEGDRVLVSGAFLFDSESRMRQSRAYPAAAR